MKYLKTLGLAAVAAAALMAFVGVGTASAESTELFSANTTLEAPVTISSSLAPGDSAKLSTTDESSIVNTCKKSTVHGNTEEIAGTTEDNTKTNGSLTGPITALTFSECANPVHTGNVAPLSFGDLSITKIAGTDNGAVTGSGTKVTMTLGVSCNYGTGTGTPLGTLIGKTGAAEHATIAINAVINEQAPVSFLCPDTTKWVANYVVTSPTGLNVRS